MKKNKGFYGVCVCACVWIHAVCVWCVWGGVYFSFSGPAGSGLWDLNSSECLEKGSKVITAPKVNIFFSPLLPSWALFFHLK